MSLGERIWALRTARNLSQGDLADALEVSRQSVSKWENNAAVPELDKLVKMSEVFDVTLDELVTGKSPAPQSAPAVTSSIPVRNMAGFALLACAFLTFVVLTVFDSLTVSLTLASPFALCAAICFVFRKHTGLFCAWAIYLLFGFLPVWNFILIRTGIFLLLCASAAVLVYTLLEFHHLPVKPIKHLNRYLVIGYILYLLYFIKRIADYTYCHYHTGVVFAYSWLDALSFLLIAVLLTVTVRLKQNK